jgi:hypothetical protein
MRSLMSYGTGVADGDVLGLLGDDGVDDGVQKDSANSRAWSTL